MDVAIPVNLAAQVASLAVVIELLVQMPFLRLNPLQGAEWAR